jgi:hypothetical protein
VKPRKTPRWGGAMGRDTPGHMGDYGARDEQGQRVETVYYDADVVDQTMAYLNTIRTTKPNLWQAEEERDRIDALRTSIQHSLLTEAKELQSEKREQEGYFRLLQGAHMRGMLLQNAHVRQNTMTYDVIVALKQRKEALAMVDAEMIRLKTLYASVKSARSSGKTKGSKSPSSSNNDGPRGSTSMLHITIDANTPSAHDVYVYRGQVIDTPMGPGTVESIQPAEKKVTINLPFGIMYAHLNRMICWGIRDSDSGNSADNSHLVGETLDSSSDRALSIKWKKLRHALTLPSSAARGIDGFIGPLVESEGIIDPLSTANSGDIANSDSLMDNGDQDIEETANFVDHEKMMQSLSQIETGGAELMAQYFLPVTPDPDTTLSRSQLRKNLTETIGNSVKDPRLVMSHPSTLPLLIDSMVMKNSSDMQLCTTSLTSTNPGQPMTTGSWTWDASTHVMSSTLKERSELIKKLEEEVFDKLKDVSVSRKSAAKLAVDTSALRMAMFTRRVRHRNNLSERGINGGPALATLDAATVQEARLQAGSNDPVAISIALHNIAAKGEEAKRIAAEEAKLAAANNKRKRKVGEEEVEGVEGNEEEEDDEDEEDEDEDDVATQSSQADENDLPSKKRSRSDESDGSDDEMIQIDSPSNVSGSAALAVAAEAAAMEEAVMSALVAPPVSVEIQPPKEEGKKATSAKSKSKRKR